MGEVIKLINQLDGYATFYSIRLYGDYSGRIYKDENIEIGYFNDLKEAKKILINELKSNRYEK